MKVRITKNEPTALQRKVLKQECIREFDGLLDKYNHQVAVQILYILRFDYGFGQSRLQRFADRLKAMQIKTVERYELSDEDTPWLCEAKLKDSGIDVDVLLK